MRVTKNLRDLIERRAAESGRSMAAECEVMLERAAMMDDVRAFLREQSDWLDIKSCPRDETTVLAWGPHGHGQMVVEYDPNPPSPGYPWCTLDGPYYPEAAFTHWQPLGKAPT